MPVQRIRLREATTSVGCVEFDVDAPDPQAAARVLYAAYQRAHSQGLSVITVGSSQAKLLEPEKVTHAVVTLHLLDAGGDEIATLVTPDDGSTNGKAS